MTKQDAHRHYYACLIRAWREDEAGPWRVQLQLPRSGEVLLFADLLAAFAFIESQLEQEAARKPLPGS